MRDYYFRLCSVLSSRSGWKWKRAPEVSREALQLSGSLCPISLSVGAVFGKLQAYGPTPSLLDTGKVLLATLVISCANSSQIAPDLL